MWDVAGYERGKSPGCGGMSLSRDEDDEDEDSPSIFDITGISAPVIVHGCTDKAGTFQYIHFHLFILLHGMLFTNIQLDDLPATLGRFIKRLQLEEKEWLMMAVVNITSAFEYG